MILKELKVQGYRTFYQEASIRIEPDITVFTGANDVGKSAILRLLELFAQGAKGTEDDLNIETEREIDKPWDNTSEANAIFTFQLADDHSEYFVSAQQTGIDFEAQILFEITINRRKLIKMTSPNGANIGTINELQLKFPRVMLIDAENEIRSEIVADDVNAIEKEFLELSFGPNYQQKLSKLSDSRYSNHLREAESKLNDKLRNFLPSSVHLSILLTSISREPLKFAVTLKDQYEAHTPIHLRGRGFRKLITLMITLMHIDIEKERVIVLYDEPDNSLHTDAQHSFRNILEKFAQHSRVQIIYATHSPSMINSTRPRSIRLLERGWSDNNIATTTVHNKPYTDDNFYLIRTHLGINPADSLLYAPISVIIEGPTESLSLSRLFARLIDESEEEKHKGLDILSGLIHFVVAGGSRYSRWMEMAHSQGSKPIVLLDGDKISETERLKKVYPEIRFICFPEGKEFEDIVSPEIYIKALNDYIHSDKEITIDAYVEWEEITELPEQMMFSKRVARWVTDQFKYSIDKPQVMDKAIELASLDDIDLTKIDEIIDTIRDLADKL